MQTHNEDGNHLTTHGQARLSQPRNTPRTALVLYGSETGNSQDVAEEIGRLTEQLRFDTVVLDLDSVQLRDLLKFKVVVFVVATAGQGEFPQNARALWKALLSGALKSGVFRKLCFTSFGLGDSSYSRYNVAHRMLHGRLLQLGGRVFCERGEGNEQHPEGHAAGFREWTLQLREALNTSFPLPDGSTPLPDDDFPEPKFKLIATADTRSHQPPQGLTEPSIALLPIKDGYIADIVDVKRMTASDHFQDVRLFDLRLDRTYDYGPGAVAVVFPKNFSEDVQAFTELMCWQDIVDQPIQLLAAGSSALTTLVTPSPLRQFDLSSIPLTMRWLLENALDIMSIPRRSFFANLARFAGDSDEDQAYQKERLLELANPELIDELWDYTTRPKRTILEVMMDFTTVKIPWQYALSALPIMRGRQFSIASGGDLIKDNTSRTRVQLLVAIVDPPSPIIKWRRRYGICTRYMVSLRPGQQIRIQMQPGYLDVQPVERATPVIMIGPGTGVAPMRAMVYQRLKWAREAGTKPGERLQHDMLFFGCRSHDADHFFQNEWQSMNNAEALQVYTAYSRDASQPKQYVQDQIHAHATLVARTLLEQNGKVYVCGSSGNMPKGVRLALAETILTSPSISSQDEAESYLDAMEKAGRYKQETW